MRANFLKSKRILRIAVSKLIKQEDTGCDYLYYAELTPAEFLTLIQDGYQLGTYIGREEFIIDYYKSLIDKGESVSGLFHFSKIGKTIPCKVNYCKKKPNILEEFID